MFVNEANPAKCYLVYSRHILVNDMEFYVNIDDTIEVTPSIFFLLCLIFIRVEL